MPDLSGASATPDELFGRLARQASARYIGGSRTAREFAAAKLQSDPVYAAALCQRLLPSGGTFLDIGCGQGLMLALLAEARVEKDPDVKVLPIFERLVGIETRAGVARLARRALGGDAEILEADATTSPLPRCSAAVAFDVLQMMPRARQEGLLAAIRASLNPGGVLLVREADPTAGWRFAAVRIANRLKAVLTGSLRQTLCYRLPDDWLASFRRAGFDCERYDDDRGPLGNVLFRLTPTYTLDVARSFPHAGLIPLSTEGAGGVSLFRLDPASRCFDGHFDDAPILPGVAHVALALSAHTDRIGVADVLTGLRDLRFLRPLTPGDEVEVRLTPGPETRSVRFEIRRREETVSSGLLLFAALDVVRG